MVLLSGHVHHLQEVFLALLLLCNLMGRCVVPLIMAVRLIWVVQHWAHSSHWNDLHRLSLVSGMLIAHTVVGGLHFSKTILQAVAIVVMGLVMVILLVLFALQVRRREAKPSMSMTSTVVTPIRAGEQSQM